MGGRVLIIEDSAEILENIVEILTLNQYEVFTAMHAKTAIDLAVSLKPDIILCDILIPGEGGFDVLKSVRENDATRRVPFLFVTSQSEREYIQKAFDLGANGYIVKPFEGDVLINNIQSLVRTAGRGPIEPRATSESTFQPPAERAL